MSAVRTMWSLSLLSSFKAKFWALVTLGFGGWEDLRTLLTSALSSSASCWLNLVQAASMAVIYSRLGGCLGDTAKLGPLARTDLYAGVKGLLDRLMTYFGMESSREDPWGSILGGVRCKIAFPGTSAVCLGGSAVPLRSLEGPLPGWMPRVLPAWTSNLTACLTCGEVVTCLGRAFPSRGVSGGLAACLGGSAITRKGGNCLSYCWVASFSGGKMSACLGGWRSC